MYENYLDQMNTQHYTVYIAVNCMKQASSNQSRHSLHREQNKGLQRTCKGSFTEVNRPIDGPCYHLSIASDGFTGRDLLIQLHVIVALNAETDIQD